MVSVGLTLERPPWPRTKPRRAPSPPPGAEDYAEWYQQVVRAADLAENSPVRGCMVIKPWGYAHLGEHPARARPHVQGDGPQERLLPALHPQVASSRRRPSTSRASPRSARSSPTTASSPGPTAGSSPTPRRSSRSRSSSAPPRRPSSAPPSRSGCRATATSRSSSTSGPTSSAGRCARASSSARPSSSGRRGTPRTRPSRGGARGDDADARRLRRPSPSDFMAHARHPGREDRRASASPAPSTPTASRR